MWESLLQPPLEGQKEAHSSRHRGRSVTGEEQTDEEEPFRLWARFVIALGSSSLPPEALLEQART